MALQRDKVVGNAEKLVARGKIEPAIREYERLLDENPNDVNTLNRIGDLWVRIERNDEAAKVFRKIADHYARDGFFLKAIAIFKKINRLDPSKLDIYAKLAELYAKQGLAMEAKSQYMVLADYYVKHADLESAVGIYLKIAELDPHSVNVRIKLADLYTQNNQTPEALQEYERVGRMLLKRGMAAEAVQVFRKALKIDSGNVELAGSIVTALLDEKEHENAIQIVESALESNRESPRLIVLLAQVHSARGDDKVARETLERGLSSNPSDFGIRQSLAEMHLRDGDLDQAVDLIAPVIDVAPDRTEGRNAVDLLERIVMMRPDHASALEKLVSAYKRLDDDMNAFSAMARLGDAHISRREYDQAEIIFRDLAEREPENQLYRDRLAEIAQESGSAGGSTLAHETIPAPELEFDFADDLPDTIDTAASEPMPSSIQEEAAAPEAESQPLPLEPEEFEEEILDLEFPPEEPPAASPPETAAMDEKAEREAAELLEFVTEHVTEADVFAKYGLYDKAIEHLHTVLLKAPRHRPAYEKLLNIHINEGHAEQIRETANRYLALLRLEGDLQTADQVERGIWDRGYETGEPAAAEQPAEPEPAVELVDEPAVLPEEIAPVEAVDAEPPIPVIEEREIALDINVTEIESPVLEDPVVGVASSEPLPEETIEIIEEEKAPLPDDEFQDDEEILAMPEVPPAAITSEEDVLSAPAEPDIEIEFAEESAEISLESREPIEVPGEIEGSDADSSAAEASGEDTSAETATEIEPPQLEEVVSVDQAPPAEIDVSEEATIIEEPVEETAPEIEFPTPEESPVAREASAAESDVAEEATIIDEPIDEPAEQPTDEPADEAPAALVTELLPTEAEIGEPVSANETDEAEPDVVPETPVISEQDPFEEPAMAAYDGDYAASPSSEDLGELDFYIEQELLEEAGNKLETLSAQFPMHADILSRQERLQAARARIAGTLKAYEGLPDEVPADEIHPPLLSHDDVEQELIKALSDDSEAVIDEVQNDADLFAAEDDFFDLAAEIGDDLAADEEELAEIADDEQTLEQIFREFKKGVEQQLDSEDYDTHYNLGIAYKEMGLIDEAIGEFQLASKDPNRAIDGCSMLGLCFLEKGMPQLAIKWYTKGLEMPEISEEEHMGLLYDLGAAYLEVGDIDAAHKAFVEVYGINSKYRDIAGRIKQLEDVRRAT